MSARDGRTVLVAGAGISGLAAAHELCRNGIQVVVADADTRPGGKILTSPFAGRDLDAGPDAFLARVPWGRELCEELGLGDQLVSPAQRSAYVFLDGRLHRLPEGLVLGVPIDLDVLARSELISPEGLRRAARGPRAARRSPGGRRVGRLADPPPSRTRDPGEARRSAAGRHQRGRRRPAQPGGWRRPARRGGPQLHQPHRRSARAAPDQPGRPGQPDLPHRRGWPGPPGRPPGGATARGLRPPRYGGPLPVTRRRRPLERRPGRCEWRRPDRHGRRRDPGHPCADRRTAPGTHRARAGRPARAVRLRLGRDGEPRLPEPWTSRSRSTPAGSSCLAPRACS